MGLSIKNERLEHSIRELAARRGLGITSTLQLAVDNELAKDALPRKREPEAIKAAIREIQERVKKLPMRMTAEEVDAWMYDENGLPH
jgi:antitoxin VapB